MTSKTVCEIAQRQTGMYRIGRIRQAVEFLLHLLQDFCGGAVLRFAMVDLVQDCIEYLCKRKKKLN